MVFGAQWAKPSKGKCGAYEFKPCKQSRSKTDGQTFHVSRYVDYKDKELGADVLNFGDPMGFAMEATKCEGSKKGNPITQCENTLSQGQRWKLMVTTTPLPFFKAYLNSRNGVQGAYYHMKVAHLASNRRNGHFSSRMREECKKHDMKPICDHPSYCRNDANAVYIGHSNHISYRPHRRNNNWMPGSFYKIESKFNNLCVYTNNANGNNALCNIPINSHQWRNPGQSYAYTRYFMCGRVRLFFRLQQHECSVCM